MPFIVFYHDIIILGWDKICAKTFCLGLFADDVTLDRANSDILDIDFQNIFADNRIKRLSFSKCMKPGCSTWNTASGFILMISSNGNMFHASGLCEGNPLVTGDFPTQNLSQRPVTRGFDVFFDMSLNKWLRKQSTRRWFETQSRSLGCRWDGFKIVG